MANVTTWTGLIAAVAQWCNRNDPDFLDNIPVFISLAEQEMFIDLSTLGNEVYAIGNFSAGNGTVSKPSDWGKTLTFSYLDANGRITVLQRASYEMIRNYIPKQSANPIANTPRYYTDYGYDQFLISPTPLAAFKYEIAYFNKITPLGINVETNWNSMNAYDPLFYNTLDKAYRFLDNLQDAEMFKNLYLARIEAYKTYDQNRRYDRTANMMEG